MMTYPYRIARFTAILTAIVLALPIFNACRSGEPDLTSYVDPYIGTGGHGHVFMGANVPFGFVQLGPTSIPNTWDWTSGYHISDTTVIGFSHLHLSGTGIGDLSDIIFMPANGNVAFGRGDSVDYSTGQWSYFSRENEIARPGYYATRLDRYDVDVEFTATERVGYHRYRFPAAPDNRIIIDLVNGTGWDSPAEGFVQQVNQYTLEGYRFSRGWASDQKIYFRAEFSEPIAYVNVYDGGEQVEGTSLHARMVYAEAGFDLEQGGELSIKVALSPVSCANAAENLAAELPGWDFEGTVGQATAKWNAELGKIRIETDDLSVKRTFYTGLYHTMIAPSIFCDVNGEYRGADGQTHLAEGFTNYTTFSLWDTYRAAHPLMTLIHPEKVPDMINTMLNIYLQQGKLPVWHLMACETDCMVGNPAIPVVADAILKSFGGFDRAVALEAMAASAMLDVWGLDHLKEYGYIPSDKYNEAVATGLEYALADGALAQAARHLGDSSRYAYFDRRSKSYREYFDRQTRFMRGRNSDGEFREPFDPFRSVHRQDDYTEGNAWQYTWLVPHDVQGLVDLFGGIEPFTAKLDSLFTVEGSLGEDASPDISGLIGQYAHGNEPGHHILYLYAMTGQPHKGAPLIRRVLEQMYFDKPDGLSGNEDVGQMSAWYVLSAMGIYQPEPAGGLFYFGSPIVDKAVIDVGEGRLFTIVAENNSRENIYIQRVELDGVPYRKLFIDYADIMRGGTLVFHMGSQSADWTDSN